MKPNLDPVQQQLFGPGGPFEIAEEPVRGEPMPVIKNRPRSLRDLLAGTTAHADREYLVMGSRRIRYDEHLRTAASVAHALRDRYGIGPGDRVAIVAANCPEWVVAFWATVSQGAIVSALNGWWTADEMHYGLELSEPKVLIGDRKRLARLEGGPALSIPVIEIESEFAELERHAPEAELPEASIDEDAAAAILFTSGTTGRPKGATQTHRGMVGFTQLTMANGAHRMMANAAKGVAPDPNPPAQNVSHVTAPLFHMSGMHAGFVLAAGFGGKIVFGEGRFDPVKTLELLEREKVTQWAGMGATAPRVLNHPDIGKYDLSSIRNLGQGGAPTSPTLMKRIAEVAPNGSAALGLGYGLSESTTTVCMAAGDELLANPASVGRIQPTHEIEIRDEHGKDLPEGQEGEIFIRSPYLIANYWGNPEATAKTLLPGRWLATGDIGRLVDGELYINSRARDLILRGAENIYPVEIEHRLEAHPSVAEAAVIGVEHAELGQEVKAIVVPARGASVDTDALSEWTAQTLAAFKVPAHWEVRTEPLPRNAAGKVLKNVLEGAAENRFVEE